MAPGQDHIYVVFNLPTLDSGRQRTRLLQPGPWGTDLQAASLMGLSGHSYTHKGMDLLASYRACHTSYGLTQQPLDYIRRFLARHWRRRMLQHLSSYAAP